MLQLVRLPRICQPSAWALFLVLLLTSTGAAADPWSAVIDPDNSLSFSFLQGDRAAFQTSLIGWGPNWAWAGGLQSRQKADRGRLWVGVPFNANKAAGAVIGVVFQAWQ